MKIYIAKIGRLLVSNFINESFDKIYCLNLKRRPDRWSQCEAIFKQHNLNVFRFGAIDGTTLNSNEIKRIKNKNKSNVSHYPGHVGCNLSHLSILKHARENQYNNIMVLEDDVELHPLFNTHFENYFKQLPDDWIMCYLGGNYLNIDTNSGLTTSMPSDPQGHMVKLNIRECKNLFTTTAYCLNKRGIDIYSKELESNNCLLAVDECYSLLQEKYSIYIFEPRLVYQRAGISDILNGYRDYKTMKDF